MIVVVESIDEFIICLTIITLFLREVTIY